MEKIVIDAALLKQLRGLNGSTMICDSEGNTLGVYQPLHEDELISLEPPISEEEIQRRRQIKTGKTTEEILERLGL